MKPSDLELAVPIFVGLEPARFELRCTELIRGGLPSQSFGAGIKNPAWVWPIDDDGHSQDREDRWIESRLAEHRRLARESLRLAQALQAYEREILLTRLPFSVPEPVPVKCANQYCEDSLENGLRSGECDKCRKARSRTGRAWQPKVHVNPKTSEVLG